MKTHILKFVVFFTLTSAWQLPGLVPKNYESGT